MNEYEKRVIDGRKQFLRLTQQQEKELLEVYEEAAKKTVLKALKAQSGTVTDRYLRELDKALVDYTKYLRTNLDKVVKNTTKESAKIASNIQNTYMDMIAPSQDLKSSFNKMFTQLSDNVVKQLISGKYYEDGKTLDKRLWNITEKNGKDIDKLIKVNIAQGTNAKELAKELQQYINPSNPLRAKTFSDGIDKNISYQARRLARTSLTHAHSESYSQGSKMNPFCKGLKWNLSPSHSSRMHGRTDICDERATQNEFGLGQGVFPANECPIQHCNCLCYFTQEVIDTDKARNELIDWLNGEDNPKLDNWLDEFGEEFGIEKNESKEKVKDSFPKTKDGSKIKDKKVVELVDNLKELNVANFESRRSLAKNILRTLDLDNIRVGIKAVSDNGYCLIASNGGKSTVHEYVLKSNDMRGNNYKIKTAFHEAFHAKNHGMVTDYDTIGKKWVEIEETFAETSAHFLVKEMGIKEEISPAYAEKLVNVLPRLKQIDKFKDCTTFADFGEIAWTDRLNGHGAKWEDLYNKCMSIDYKWQSYAKNYLEYIDENKEDLVDVMIKNMPGYEGYKEAMVSDCKYAIKSIELNEKLSGNENLVIKNLLAITMNRLGVR